ncbi:carbohydrate ABC transporter permease [Mesorhizobium sp. CAU 1741]|uniref:carbohydrate ABC transporter permease n=1 Tax=Mesorhizobium sp. CAU 1741 TaxID=3140366 RepID=UPI00325B8E12
MSAESMDRSRPNRRPARRRLRVDPQGLAIHAILIAVSAVIVSPLLWMVVTSMKEHQDVFTQSLWYIPPEPKLLENIQHVFDRIDFFRYFFNSLFVSTAITLLDLLFASMCGFALAKYRFPGRQIVFGSIIATMMIPFIVILVPQYILVRDLGWLDSYAGLIIPAAISSFGIFMMRQAFLSTPDELLDAARIDGAGEWRILFQIVLPMHVPPLVSLAILRFLGEWDNLLWPLVVTNGESMRTMSLGLALLQDDRYGTDIPMLMTAATMALFPIVLVYVFLQRYFIKSVAGSGLKQ